MSSLSLVARRPNFVMPVLLMLARPAAFNVMTLKTGVVMSVVMAVSAMSEACLAVPYWSRSAAMTAVFDAGVDVTSDRESEKLSVLLPGATANWTVAAEISSLSGKAEVSNNPMLR